ncbi:hypothetical protein GEMRC1_009135 [Eukaryota sp. GEM-RC1]
MDEPAGFHPIGALKLLNVQDPQAQDLHLNSCLSRDLVVAAFPNTLYFFSLSDRIRTTTPTVYTVALSRAVSFISLSKDGSFLATLSSNSQSVLDIYHISNPLSSSPSKVASHSFNLRCSSISFHKNLIFLSSDSSLLCLKFENRSLSLLHEVDLPVPVISSTLSPNSPLLALSSSTGSIIIVDFDPSGSNPPDVLPSTINVPSPTSMVWCLTPDRSKTVLCVGSTQSSSISVFS